MAGERVEQRQALNFFVKQLNAQGDIVRFRREDVDHLAAHPEGAALEGLIVAGILQFGQAAQDRPLVNQHPHRQMQHHFQIQVRVAEAVNSRDRGHHHHIAPLKQRFSGRQAHLLDMFVYRGVLLNEGI